MTITRRACLASLVGLLALVRVTHAAAPQGYAWVEVGRYACGSGWCRIWVRRSL